MFLAIVAGQAISAKQLLEDAWSQFSNAKSLTMTMVLTSEEHRWPIKDDITSKFSWRKGGFFRMEAGADVDVCDSKSMYMYRTDKKIYQVEHHAPADLEMLLGQLGIHAFHAGWPVIGDPIATTWHGFKTIRIELDGRKEMTPEAKVYAFVDPNSHLPVGVSGNLGSITQVVIFKNIKINPKLDDSLFQFTPPKDWKKVTKKKTGGAQYS